MCRHALNSRGCIIIIGPNTGTTSLGVDSMNNGTISILSAKGIICGSKEGASIVGTSNVDTTVFGVRE